MKRCWHRWRTGAWDGDKFYCRECWSVKWKAKPLKVKLGDRFAVTWGKDEYIVELDEISFGMGSIGQVSLTLKGVREK